MERKTKIYQLLLYEAHLLGDIKKCLKIIDRFGTYFYIKHYKDTEAAHYHFYFASENFTDELQIKTLFEKYVASRVHVEKARMDKYSMINYMLQDDKYSFKDIKATMSL